MDGAGDEGEGDARTPMKVAVGREVGAELLDEEFLFGEAEGDVNEVGVGGEDFLPEEGELGGVVFEASGGWGSGCRRVGGCGWRAWWTAGARSAALGEPPRR